jgi:uncharacterized OB-fold protein
MIENLEYIRKEGIEKFLAKEAEKWQCPKCGGVICCHDGICYSCGGVKLKKRNLHPVGGLRESRLFHQTR